MRGCRPLDSCWTVRSCEGRVLADLRRQALKRLEALVRDRLKSLQYKPSILEGFIAGTGLTLQPPRPRSFEISSSGYVPDDHQARKSALPFSEYRRDNMGVRWKTKLAELLAEPGVAGRQAK